MLGEVLRAERERRQLTIHDIEEATSIRALYIESIENGNYEKLPGDVYTKGFIKNYATFLNLDSKALVDEFVASRKPAELTVAEEIAADNKKILDKKVDDLQDTMPTERIPRRARNERVMERSSSGGSSFGIIAAVILIAAIAGGAWYYFTSTDGEIADVDNKPKIEQPVNGGESQPPAQTQQPGAVAAAPTTGVNIQAKFTGDCWTEVVVDGMVVYEEVAHAGQALNWTGNESVIIRVGNAGAIDITENGRQTGRLGEIGEVVEKTFRRT